MTTFSGSEAMPDGDMLLPEGVGRIPPEPEATLGVVLHAHAAARERTTLLLQALDGTLMASVALFSHARPWLFVASAGCGIVMHAVWSVADRRLSAGSSASRGYLASWRLVRALGATLGVAAVFTMLLLSCGRMLGTWIS